jgi:hypothetical protein
MVPCMTVFLAMALVACCLISLGGKLSMAGYGCVYISCTTPELYVYKSLALHEIIPS